MHGDFFVKPAFADAGGQRPSPPDYCGSIGDGRWPDRGAAHEQTWIKSRAARHRAKHRAATLHSVESAPRFLTMKQPCASAATLKGAGPFRRRHRSHGLIGTPPLLSPRKGDRCRQLATRVRPCAEPLYLPFSSSLRPITRLGGVNEHVSKKLLGFFDSGSSNSLILSCVLFDQMIPFDRDALNDGDQAANDRGRDADADAARQKEYHRMWAPIGAWSRRGWRARSIALICSRSMASRAMSRRIWSMRR
ncbi:MAG: hypothetical protein DLM68_16470 [Hyphomicrobiales bacterium]|nr:MAG: hypothetical protein DLM68_16470 [Hyphomicrobiales bacterium]